MRLRLLGTVMSSTFFFYFFLLLMDLLNGLFGEMLFTTQQKVEGIV
jgi:uncharacterized membrane protein YccC